MFFVQNGMTKNLGWNLVFFFNRGIHGQKLRQKVESPISGKNTQMIASGNRKDLKCVVHGPWSVVCVN